MPEQAFAATEQKIDSFAAGAGSILFFEDMAVVKGLQEQFPLYADNFPIWSEQASGIAQFAVWTALAQENVGASLQHYNPLIDTQVQKEWEHLIIGYYVLKWYLGQLMLLRVIKTLWMMKFVSKSLNNQNKIRIKSPC